MPDPFTANITLEGDARIERKLSRIGGFHPRHSGPVIQAHAKSETSRLRSTPYPPELPNQVYIRTGRLGREFHYFQVDAGTHGVKNTRENAVWVIWRGMQNRRWHLGRWWTFQAQIESRLPQLMKALGQKADELLRRD